MRLINPPALGASLASYSQAVAIPGVLLLAGQVSLAADGSVVGVGDVRRQVQRIMERAVAILEGERLRLSDVAAANVVLRRREDYADFNDAWAAAFGNHRPVRTLTLGELVLEELLVEIQLTAVPRSATSA